MLSTIVNKARWVDFGMVFSSRRASRKATVSWTLSRTSDLLTTLPRREPLPLGDGHGLTSSSLEWTILLDMAYVPGGTLLARLADLRTLDDDDGDPSAERFAGVVGGTTLPNASQDGFDD